jgi:hypothetical protein
LNENWLLKQKYSIRTFASASSSTTNPTRLEHARTQASSVGSLRLSAGAMAGPGDARDVKWRHAASCSRRMETELAAVTSPPFLGILWPRVSALKAFLQQRTRQNGRKPSRARPVFRVSEAFHLRNLPFLMITARVRSGYSEYSDATPGRAVPQAVSSWVRALAR